MSRKRKTKVQVIRPIIHPHVAGADIGAREIYVAVPAEGCPEPVRCFPTFTEDLKRLVAWLLEHRVKSVAMEATSVYWIPLAELLEDAGVEVCLVNPRHVKNVPGRKTDVMDCQWLQYLHSVGLLRGAFRPPAQVRAARALWRHRDALVRHQSWHIQHLHKALDQMNLQVHHVISDITGATGLAMLDAILAGQRDPARLAALRDYRIKAPEEVLRKALVGDYREEHLFCLAQALAGYRFVQSQIVDLDKALAGRLAELTGGREPASDAPKGSKRTKNAPGFDAQTLLEKICGVDLCTVPGLSALTCQTIWSELGTDLSAFPTAKHFASWLSLSPDNRISGGKLLGVRTRPSANRVASALRMAAQALHHAKNELGDYYRRMRAKLGGAAAITATAHKLARILYAMLKSRLPYDPGRHNTASARHQERTLARIKAKAKALGFTLVPAPSTSAVS